MKAFVPKFQTEVFWAVEAQEHDAVVLPLYTQPTGMRAYIDIGGLFRSVIGDADHDGLRHIELGKGCLLYAARIHIASQHGNRRPRFITCSGTANLNIVVGGEGRTVFLRQRADAEWG